MKKKLLYLSLSFALIISSISLTVNSTKKVQASTNTSEIIIELESGRILHEKNINEKMFMASTTKILTAITVIENCNIDNIVAVTDKTVGVEGSSIYLEAGEKLSVKDLLYGLMLRSGNDCAETLAVYCSGSVQNFAELMNATAKRIGAVNSNFVNPHGLHDDNHYTTAYDLALISRYAMKNRIFREIVSTKSIQIPFSTRNSKRFLINKNKMLKEFDGSTGIKTGYTKKAGRCLVSSCFRNGMELICVVLNCPPMFERSKTLMTECFDKYKNYKMFESDHIVDFIKTDSEDCGLYIKKDIIIPLTENEFDNIKIVYDYPNFIKKPFEKDTEIGFIKIYAENNLIFSEKVYTIIGIK